MRTSGHQIWLRYGLSLLTHDLDNQCISVRGHVHFIILATQGPSFEFLDIAKNVPVAYVWHVVGL